MPIIDGTLGTISKKLEKETNGIEDTVQTTARLAYWEEFWRTKETLLKVTS